VHTVCKKCCHKIWSNSRWAGPGSTKLLGIVRAGLFYRLDSVPTAKLNHHNRLVFINPWCSDNPGTITVAASTEKLCHWPTLVSQGVHSPVMIKFPDISSDYLRGIDPRNSRDKKMKCVLFHDIFTTTMFFNVLQCLYRCKTNLYLVNNSFFAHFVSGSILAVIDARTHFRWLFPDQS